METGCLAKSARRGQFSLARLARNHSAITRAEQSRFADGWVGAAGVRRLAGDVERLANAEGLLAHARAVAVRR